jgi:predicted RNA methylase
MMGRRGTAKGTRRGPALGVGRGGKVKTAGGAVGQWWTPTWLADLFAAWCGIRPGDRVLDAGAGRGALALAALARGADVTMVERDPKHADALEREIGHRGRVVCADFLALIPVPALAAHTLVVSNPPWEGTYPERFIARALEIAPRVCAILPVNVLFGVGRAEYWQEQPVRITRARALARRPRFHGTRGGMRDVVLLEARRRVLLGPQRFELEVGDA